MPGPVSSNYGRTDAKFIQLCSNLSQVQIYEIIRKQRQENQEKQEQYTGSRSQY